MKLLLGIEKYAELKKDLAVVTKEKKVAEKGFEKTVEKYDHKIAKLKNKIYTLKDELEDKNSELEKSNEKVKKLSDTCEQLGVEIETEEESSSESETEFESEIDLAELMQECISAQQEGGECLVKASDDTPGADVFIDEKAIEENAILLSEIVAARLEEEALSDTDSLEDVIEDMTEEREMLQAKIEELEHKLTRKGSGDVSDWVKSSEDDLSISTEDNLDLSTEDNLSISTEDYTAESETESEEDMYMYNHGFEDEIKFNGQTGRDDSSLVAELDDLGSVSSASLYAKSSEETIDSEFEEQMAFAFFDENNNINNREQKAAEIEGAEKSSAQEAAEKESAGKNNAQKAAEFQSAEKDKGAQWLKEAKVLREKSAQKAKENARKDKADSKTEEGPEDALVESQPKSVEESRMPLGKSASAEQSAAAKSAAVKDSDKASSSPVLIAKVFPLLARDALHEMYFILAQHSG